jgi:hypothetical protein
VDADQEERKDGTTLDELVSSLATCPPVERIDRREPILAHGSACIAPLLALVTREPDLSSAVAAWLEVLVRRDPAMRTDVVAALRQIAKGPDGAFAIGALGRLGASASAPSRGRATPGRPTPPTDVVVDDPG